MTAETLPLGPNFPLNTATVTRHPKGVAYVWVHAPFVVTRVEGYLSVEVAQAIDAATRKNIAEARGQRLSAYHDWWDVEDYASEARTRLTGLGREIEKDSDKVHILFRSRIVAFGVKAASVLLSNIEVYANSERFLLAVEKAERTRR